MNIKIIRTIFEILKRSPAVFVPFLCMGVVDLLTAIILFLAPRPPFATVLAPVIKAFWGEQFLHYPVNFLLLPKLFTYSRYITGILIGMIFTGIAVVMIAQSLSGQKPEFWIGFKKSIRKYLRLVLISILAIGSALIAAKLTRRFGPILDSSKLSFVIELLLTTTVQMLFVYAIPSVIIENRKVVTSLIRSLALVKHYPITSFLIVFLPTLLFTPVILLNYKTPMLMDKIAPEIVLYSIYFRIFIIALADAFITLSAVIVLILHKETEK